MTDIDLKFNESFEIIGNWEIKNISKISFPGILKHTPQKTTLDLTSSESEESTSQFINLNNLSQSRQPILITSKTFFGFVILPNAHIIKLQNTTQCGLLVGKYQFIISDFYINRESVKPSLTEYEQISFNVDELTNWIDITGFDISNMLNLYNYTTTYNAPPNLTFKICDDLELIIFFGGYQKSDSAIIPRKFPFTETVHMSMQVSNNSEYQTRKEYVSVIKNFISFVTHKPTSLLFIKTKHKGSELNNNHGCDIFFTDNLYGYKNLYKPINPLVPFSLIKDNLGMHLQKLLESKILNSIIYSYVELLYSNTNIIQKFLQVIQELEYFFNNSESLKHKNNNLYLKCKLKIMFEKCSLMHHIEIQLDSIMLEDLCYSIAETRAYYTHHTKNYHSFFESAVYYLKNLLLLLIESCILFELEIEPLIVTSILKISIDIKRYNFKQLPILLNDYKLEIGSEWNQRSSNNC